MKAPKPILAQKTVGRKSAHTTSDHLTAMGSSIELHSRHAVVHEDEAIKKAAEHRTIHAINAAEYAYDFQNLVFSGGGAKCVAHLGVYMCLKENGVPIKRFSGTSGGSTTALMLVLGYTPEEVLSITSEMTRNPYDRHTCGCFSWLPNLVKKYGVFSGQRLYRQLGKHISKKTKNPNTTFKELYELTGKELCIIGTNVNLMAEEYFHVKTHPYMPVRMAVRISMSIPFMYEPVKTNAGLNMCHYADGGLLCNFPIHCYDGWWLSMKKEDNFFRKIGSIEDGSNLLQRENRFAEFNKRTVGSVVTSTLEPKPPSKENILEHVERPDTKLKRTKCKFIQIAKEKQKETDAMKPPLCRLFKMLIARAVTESGLIEKGKFLECMEESQYETSLIVFSKFDYSVLFGRMHAEEIFAKIDVDGNGTISFDELMHFFHVKGKDTHTMLVNCHAQWNKIKSFKEYVGAMSETLLSYTQKNFVSEEDIDRTIAVDTDYIGTIDFDMCPEDQMFLVEQGYRSTLSFLKRYAAENDVPKRSDTHQIKQH